MTALKAPVGLWVSTDFASFLVGMTDAGRVDGENTAPIARWAHGKRFTTVVNWARRHDRQASFAWFYEDGTASEVWR